MIIRFLGSLLILYTISVAQAEWQTYNTVNSPLPDNQVHDIEIDKNNIRWFATASGLAEFDGNLWTIYDTVNSPLPSSFITAVESDDNGILWAGTDKGLVCFDGTNWIVYDTSNSRLESNNITKIISEDNILWVGTDDGLLRYDGNTWIIFNDMNSGLFVDQVHSIAMDKDNNLWIGVFEDFSFRGILIKFDGTDWSYYFLNTRDLPSSFPDALAVDNKNNVWLGTKGTTGGSLVNVTNEKWDIYTRNNSPFPGGGISSLAFQDSILWISTSMGLISFSGSDWDIYDTDNSEIPDNISLSVEIDNFGNKWLGTISSGAAVFNEGGILNSTDKNNRFPVSFQLNHNFPNPFNPATNIRFAVSVEGIVSLKIYNINGQLIKTITDEYMEAGDHETQWDATDVNGIKVSSGIYFCRISVSGNKENFSKVNKMILLK